MNYPLPSSVAVSAVMRANRRRDTKPELRIRRALHAQGYRYRVDYPIVVGNVRVRPDLVFTRQRVAVFVDGCFFHSCPEHGNQPRVNVGYWRPKLARNVQRDQLVTAALKSDGWSVVRVWEHEDAALAAAGIAEIIECCRYAQFSISSTESASGTSKRLGRLTGTRPDVPSPPLGAAREF